jgi:2-polyprenyl-3-methyl-5-hydroxy-6-metoxy-1,4-benzoquinol methylase
VNQDHQATIQTWDDLWDRSDPQLAARRLEEERHGTRWNTFRAHLEQTFGSRRLRCVELGSGEGDFSVLLAELGHEVTLVDFSPKALRRAEQRLASLGLSGQFIEADLFQFAHDRAGTFDVSLSLGVAEHFSGQSRQRIVEAHRQVLAPGGVTLISVPNAACFPYRMWKLYLQARGWWTYGYEAPFHRRELTSLALHSGFNECRAYGTGFAASVDRCLLKIVTGRQLGWKEGPPWINHYAGWAMNLLAKAA